MRGFLFSVRLVICAAVIGFSTGGAWAQGNPASADKKVYNKAEAAQTQPAAKSGLFGLFQSRQPYKMQTMQVKKSYEELLAEAEQANAINAERQRQVMQAENQKRYQQALAAYEADRASKQAERAAKAANQSGTVRQGSGGLENASAPVGAPSSGIRQQIPVYIPKKKDGEGPEKPRRLFNVREQ